MNQPHHRPDPYTERPWLNPAISPFIQIQGVTKRFGDFTAVNAVDLAIYQGELFALLGGSGCGKTTLLRMLAGFETPTEGRIIIDGLDMTEVPPYERPVNMMFQSYALFPHMNVFNNIAYGLRRDGIKSDELKRRVNDIIDMVELNPLTHRRPHQLSGGQRQRVALARALVKQPKVLLLDEPLAALDKRLREQTQFELMNIQDQLGITFVVVTHDQEEAMTLATRIAVMGAGQFEQVGTPADIYENPQTRFIAGFIGSANLLSGTVQDCQPEKGTDDAPDISRVQIVTDEGNQLLSVSTDRVVAAGDAVTLAIRPEKISVTLQDSAVSDTADKVPDNAPNTVSNNGSGTVPGYVSGNVPENVLWGTVQEMAYLGRLSTFRIKTDAGPTLEVTAPNQRRVLDNRHLIDWDDRVRLTFSSDSAVLLTR